MAKQPQPLYHDEQAVGISCRAQLYGRHTAFLGGAGLQRADKMPGFDAPAAAEALLTPSAAMPCISATAPT